MKCDKRGCKKEATHRLTQKPVFTKSFKKICRCDTHRIGKGNEIDWDQVYGLVKEGDYIVPSVWKCEEI